MSFFIDNIVIIRDTTSHLLPAADTDTRFNSNRTIEAADDQDQCLNAFSPVNLPKLVSDHLL